MSLLNIPTFFFLLFDTSTETGIIPSDADWNHANPNVRLRLGINRLATWPIPLHQQALSHVVELRFTVLRQAPCARKRL